MPQLDFDGNAEEPIAQRVWLVILELQRDGRYDDQEIARVCLQRGVFPGEWKESAHLRAATMFVHRVGTQRDISGVSPALHIGQPHQMRLRIWCVFDEKLDNLKAKIAAYHDDGHGIRLDAGKLIKEHPTRKGEVLAVIPSQLRPDEK